MSCEDCYGAWDQVTCFLHDLEEIKRKRLPEEKPRHDLEVLTESDGCLDLAHWDDLCEHWMTEDGIILNRVTGWWPLDHLEGRTA